MKILAIDHGIKRIGIAISDELEISAKALPTIHFTHESLAIKQIHELIKSHNCELLVVGIPTGHEGQDSTQTKIVRDFIKKLNLEIDIPITEWDETYSSKIASQNIKGKKKHNLDSESAKVILIEYMNSKISN